MACPTRIVVIGTGFARPQLLWSLAGRLASNCTLTRLSYENDTTFSPMLPQTVGASIVSDHVIVPVRKMLRTGGARQFNLGSVAEVDVGACAGPPHPGRCQPKLAEARRHSVHEAHGTP